MKRIMLWCLILIMLLSACDLNPQCDEAHQCMHILFIGNSYTYVNDLPAMLTELAKSDGKRMETAMIAEGGLRLADHAANQATLDQIAATKWDYVILQEQSQIPAVEQARVDQMYPAARTLVGKIRAAGATPLFYITWGHRGGYPEKGMPDSASMQAQISYGYSRIAQELNASVAPVGNAWAVVVAQHSDTTLWQEDGSHPTEAGTYLAACVFYTVLYKESPEGLVYRGHLSKDIAATLQKIAAETALPKQYNLPSLP